MRIVLATSLSARPRCSEPTRRRRLKIDLVKVFELCFKTLQQPRETFVLQFEFSPLALFLALRNSARALHLHFSYFGRFAGALLHVRDRSRRQGGNCNSRQADPTSLHAILPSTNCRGLAYAVLRS